jgi:uncharacterized protein YdcH (DUF465 family)
VLNPPVKREKKAPFRVNHGRSSEPWARTLPPVEGLTNRGDYFIGNGLEMLKLSIKNCCLFQEVEMATREEELIERLIKENEGFSKAKQAHVQLAKQLEELEKRPFLTPEDEIEIKILKKRKLAVKDQMEKILMQYR